MKLGQRDFSWRFSLTDYFHAKLILFGEYVILNGGDGFAVPFRNYRGQLIKNDQTDENGRDALSKNGQLDFNQFIQHIMHSPTLRQNFNLNQLQIELNQIQFDSDIPMGYGIGSSGALCASICFKFLKQKISRLTNDQEEILFLKDILSLLESYYHGSSSGIDPLISYLDRPVYLKDNCTSIKFKNLTDRAKNLLDKAFLLDSQKSRKASLLVHKYLQKIDSKQISSKTLMQMIELNNLLINNLLCGDENNFKINLHEFSKLQFLYFKDMIPDELNSLWYQGLEHGDFLIKLCGAGGGGYSLGWKFSPKADVFLQKFHTIDNLQI